MDFLQRTMSKRLDPALVLPGAKSVIVLGVSYGNRKSHDFHSAKGDAGVNSRNGRIEKELQGHSSTASLPVSIAQFAHFQDYHEIIGQSLNRLVSWIDQSWPGTVVSRGYVDTGPCLERELAMSAGIGFVGKHTNLISQHYGNELFIALVLTGLDLAPDAPQINRCGKCDHCMRVCPTGAIRAPFQLDARLCISYLTIECKGSIPVELRSSVGNRVFGCDDCIKTCPWNRFSKEGSLMVSQTRNEIAVADLRKMIRMTPEQFRVLYRGTSLERLRYKRFMRNVCVALGNSGAECDCVVLKELARVDDPMIAEHAQWAMDQIKQRFGLAVKTSC